MVIFVCITMARYLNNFASVPRDFLDTKEHFMLASNELTSELLLHEYPIIRPLVIIIKKFLGILKFNCY